jgi:hypothetical protein
LIFNCPILILTQIKRYRTIIYLSLFVAKSLKKNSFA